MAKVYIKETGNIYIFGLIIMNRLRDMVVAVAIKL